jgi:hypothetical protein
MTEHDLASLGLSFRETHKKSDYLLEVCVSLYHAETRDLIATFSTTTRTSDGEQVLNTNSQFIQRRYLTFGQIDAVTQWLRNCTIAARWRLTSFTTMVDARS